MSIDRQPMTPPDIAAELARLAGRLSAARRFNVGFPGATDIDFSPLADMWRHLLNNVGDPNVDGAGAHHTKAFEREVVRSVAELLRAPVGNWWGYVTTGGSEGNEYGLHLARGLHPDGIVYLSAQAHQSLIKSADRLRLPHISIRTDAYGVMDYDDLADQVDRHRHRPAIVAATAGTTMSEAVDDLHQIRRVLDATAVARRFVHVDAALSGIPLALLPSEERPGFDFTDGADAITVSGHKFLGVPTPCGVVVTRESHRGTAAAWEGGYGGSPDTTITNSRSGHTPLMLWYVLRALGIEGLRDRADAARRLAAYLHARLLAVGWEAHRHSHAFTVVLRTPPKVVTDRWVLATRDEWSHLITMPGVGRDVVDEFLYDLEAARVRSEFDRLSEEDASGIAAVAAVT
jgi:histidine decarboxylase